MADPATSGAAWVLLVAVLSAAVGHLSVAEPCATAFVGVELTNSISIDAIVLIPKTER
jgi:hypothetical protein